MAEDVALDFQENIIEINGPPLEDTTTARLMHHTAEVKFNILLCLYYYLELINIPLFTNINMDNFQGITQYRQAGHCFLLNQGFDDVFSTDMDDWYQVGTLYLFFLHPV